jgi:hypothetical protein
MSRDINLASSRGWTLTACHDGEWTSLHVSHTNGRCASLTAAVDTGEAADRRGEYVQISATDWNMLEGWYDRHDEFLARAKTMMKKGA